MLLKIFEDFVRKKLFDRLRLVHIFFIVEKYTSRVVKPRLAGWVGG
jgi:hypothetical protein